MAFGVSTASSPIFGFGASTAPASSFGFAAGPAPAPGPRPAGGLGAFIQIKRNGVNVGDDKAAILDLAAGWGATRGWGANANVVTFVRQDQLFLLLHGNGSNGNNLVDSSFAHRTPDANPSTGLVISASADAWGGKAIETNPSLGAGDYRKYTLPFASAGQAFTLEYFLQIISSSGDGDGYAEGRQEVIRLESNNVAGFAHSANCCINASTSLTLTNPGATACSHAAFGITGGKTQRVHVAYQRYAGVGTQCFLQGRYVADGGVTEAITALVVGGRGLTSRNARAWLDGIRFTRGKALYPQRTAESVGTVIFSVPSVVFEPDEPVG